MKKIPLQMVECFYVKKKSYSCGLIGSVFGLEEENYGPKIMI